MRFNYYIIMQGHIWQKIRKEYRDLIPCYFLSMKKSNIGIVLAIGSCLGTIGAVIFTIRAGPKAEKIYKKLDESDSSLSEYISNLLPVYYPTIFSAGLSITCSITQAILFKKTEQLWTNAYGALLATCFSKASNKSKPVQVCTIPDEEILYFDEISGEYFYSSRSKVEKAIVELNRKLNTDGFATMNSFANLLNIPISDSQKGLGWASEELLENTGSSWITIIPTTTIIGPDLSCEALIFLTPPTDDYGPF